MNNTLLARGWNLQIWVGDRREGWGRAGMWKIRTRCEGIEWCRKRSWCWRVVLCGNRREPDHPLHKTHHHGHHPLFMLSLLLLPLLLQFSCERLKCVNKLLVSWTHFIVHQLQASPGFSVDSSYFHCVANRSYNYKFGMGYHQWQGLIKSRSIFERIVM